MNKKFLAIFIAVIMLVGMIPALSTIPPAKAQAVPCDPTVLNNHPFCVYLHPGAGDTYKAGWSQTLDTLWGTQSKGKAGPADIGDPQTSQLKEYLNYAILASAKGTTSSVGDLQFDITVLDTISAVEFFIPPEFKFTAPTKEESVWTDLTNDYAFIMFNTNQPTDPIAPNWTRVMIGIEEYWGSGPQPGDALGSKIDPGTYHVRFFSLAAPDIAGLYHFKIYYWDDAPVSMSSSNPLLFNTYHSLGAGNFPIIIVKSELNPAWVETTVRTELMVAPPFVSGYVVATGTTPEGRDVSAMAYWGPNELSGIAPVPDKYGNAGSEYRVILFGLAEGTYTLTAYASGAVPKPSDRFTVMAGQSYHMYITVFDSPDIFVTIYSKHGTGELPWGNLWQLPFGTNDPYASPCETSSFACPRRDLLLELRDSTNALASFWASDDRDYRLAANGITSSSFHRWFGWANRLNPAGAGISPLAPTATSYSVHLVDNYDVLYNARGFPATQWDGHVPWDTADYVSGILNGQYTLEAYVTGYVMDQADAYQRSFVVTGIEKNIPFDLRRSNWMEVQMHMPSGVALSATTTVLLTADDANGGERAAAAFPATGGTHDVLCAWDLALKTCMPSIVVEGKNSAYLQGSGLFRGSGGSFAQTEKDYGLNPTASTHSGGAVALAGNPYTIKLWMADMGKPWTTHLVGGKSVQWVGTGFWNPVGGDPQTSIFLCNSPTTLSFTIRPAWLQVFLRSVDFEVPAHARPWTFPGSEIWLEFKDESGATVDRTDPTVDGFIQDAGTTYGNPGVVYPIPGVDYLTPEGVQVGYGVTPYDYDNSVPACPPAQTNCAGYHSVLRYTYAGIDWTSAPAWNSYPLYRALYNGGHRPTRLPPGPYMVDVHTHGYVLRRAFPVQVPAEGGADIQADLIQGAQIRVIMSFKHEDVKTLFNGFVRMEVLNEAGDLVGASVYGTAEPNRFTELGAGGAYFSASPDDPYWSWTYGDSMKIGGPAGGAGFGEPYTLYPSASPGQRAMWSNLYYDVPYCPDMRNPACQVWASWDYTSPLDANKFGPTDTLVVDVFGFYWYHGDAARTWAGGWPTTNGLSNSGKQVGANGLAWDSGLRGSDDLPNWAGSGGGTYTIKIYAFDYDAQRMYAMGWPLNGISVPWGGADDQYVDMNALATLKGTVSWLDMYGTYRYLPWAQIGASPGPGDNTMAYGTPGYLMWLPAGSHDVSVSTSEAPGVWGGPAEQNGQYTVVVSNGWVGGGESRLDHTGGVPVPELPVYVLPFGLLAVLGAAVWLLRKQNLNTPVLMK